MKPVLALVLTALSTTSLSAKSDATLVYQLQASGSVAVDRTISISRFFARVDASETPGEYLLFQAGKFFPLYSVDEGQHSYRPLTPPVDARLGPVAAQPTAPPSQSAPLDEQTAAAPRDGTGPVGSTSATAQPAPSPAASSGDQAPPTAAADLAPDVGDLAEKDAPTQTEPTPRRSPALPTEPTFKPSAKMDEVAGIRCRIVFELIDGEPAVEHCMANKAALGITERESRTLARLFVMARKRGYDWLGASTKDEDFVSVRSQDLKRGKRLTLQSLSTEPLPVGHLRVPKEFTEIAWDAAPEDAAGKDAEGGD